MQKAEALGFDLVFALSQWLPKGGYGGVFNGEACACHDAIVAHGDEAGFHRFDSDAHAWRGNAGQRNQAAARAVGGNISIVGSPQQIADYIVRLHQAGVDGVQLSFFDFLPDLDFFGERVLPLLREAGLRY